MVAAPWWQQQGNLAEELRPQPSAEGRTWPALPTGMIEEIPHGPLRLLGGGGVCRDVFRCVASVDDVDVNDGAGRSCG